MTNDPGCECGAGASSELSNRPGLSEIRARIGAHASFFEAMKAKLSQAWDPNRPNRRPLKSLRTRDVSDPAIAWLDAWAVLGDILTFYQERIANEGYLRTATEFRSLAELARLVGYAPRPGVSASCHLAYTLQDGQEVIIPAGARVTNTPLQNELPVTFETAEPLRARARWNAISPRRKGPQQLDAVESRNVERLALAGIATNLKPGDLLLLEFPDQATPTVRRVAEVQVDAAEQRTIAILQIDKLSSLQFLRNSRIAISLHRKFNLLADAGSLPAALQDKLKQLDKDNSSQIARLDTATGARFSRVLLDRRLTDEFRPLAELKDRAKALADNAFTVGTAARTLNDGLPKTLTVDVDELKQRVTKAQKDFANEEALLKAVVDAVKVFDDYQGVDLNEINTRATAVKDAVKLLLKDIPDPQDPQSLEVIAKGFHDNIPGPLSSATEIVEFRGKFNEAKAPFVAGKFLQRDEAPVNTWMKDLSDALASETQLSNITTKIVAVRNKLKEEVSLAPSTGLATRITSLLEQIFPLGEFRKSILKLNGDFDTAIKGVSGAHPELVSDVKTATSAFQNDTLFEGTTSNLEAALAKCARALQAALDNLAKLHSAARRLETSVNTLSSSLITSVWAARQHFVALIAGLWKRNDAIKRFAGGAGAAAEATAEVVKIVSDAVSELEGLVKLEGFPKGSIPTINQLENSQLEKLNARVRSTITNVDPMGPFYGKMSKDAQLLADRLLSDLKTESERAQPQSDKDEQISQQSDLGNEFAGLINIENQLSAVRPNRIDRPPTLNPSLILGAPEKDRANDALASATAAIDPERSRLFFEAWRGRRYEADRVRVFVLRQKTQVFGYNAPQVLDNQQPPKPTEIQNLENETTSRLFLSDAYDGVLPGSYIVIESPGKADTADAVPNPLRIAAATVVPRTAYGISARTTRIDLEPSQNWRDDDSNNKFLPFRTTAVYVQSEELPLAEIDIDQDVGQSLSALPQDPTTQVYRVGSNQIELDDLYDGLEVGRPLIIEGERADLSGAVDAELAVIVGVTHVRRTIFGDTPHTLLNLSAPLSRSYKRSTVVVRANVVRANHGESHGRTEGGTGRSVGETLGSGNAAIPFQHFPLRFAPLTHLAAPTAEGAEPALRVLVNDVEWRRVSDFSSLGPNDRAYVLRIDEAQQATVVFGDGRRGSRLPTGQNNIRARYRSGLGSAGNVGRRRIDQLVDRPLGVMAVVNPLPASGGADRDTTAQIRWNAPLGLRALDRVVSVRDYGDFARTFAGIGKAVAVPLPSVERRAMHVTIAGPDPEPIGVDSDLFQNLRMSFLRQGDALQPVVLQPADRVLMVVVANVRVADGHQFSVVEARVRARLLDVFGYRNRELGQSVTASEVLSVMHNVEGVDFADLDILGAIRRFQSAEDITKQIQALQSQLQAGPSRRIDVRLARRVPESSAAGDRPYTPAEIAYLEANPAVNKQTLLISEVQ